MPICLPSPKDNIHVTVSVPLRINSTKTEHHDFSFIFRLSSVTAMNTIYEASQKLMLNLAEETDLAAGTISAQEREKEWNRIKPYIVGWEDVVSKNKDKIAYGRSYLQRLMTIPGMYAAVGVAFYDVVAGAAFDCN